MKVLFSLFLGILIGFANFSNLVAQSDNHQDTGYRVQDKNRLKATNQLTDCRLQVAGSNTIELLLGNLSFQIAQQFRPTTNSELPTTKCNNSGRDLSCYLMMDPDINPQAIEEVIKAVKRGLGNSANKAFLAETISESVFEGAIQGVDSSSAKVGDEPQFTEIATHSSDPIESVSFSDKNSVNPSVESVPTNHQDDPLNFNQGINPSPASHLSPLTKIRPAGQAVTSLALQIFLYNALEHANKTLADLHIDVAAARYKREAVSKAWAQIIPTAERVVQYINNCLVDCDSNGIYPHGLVAIDRAEEALKLRIKEAKNIEKWDSTTYPITADGMESAAKYMVNSLLAEKAGNKFLAKNWIEAAELSIAKNRNPFLHIGLVAKKEEVLKSSSNRGAACYNGSSRSQVDNILALQKGIQNAKDFLAHALSYDDHATKAKMTDSQKMIDLWMQAAEQSRIACVNQVKANLFYSSKNEAQARYLEKAVASAVEKRDQYASIAEYTTNALQAKATGNQELFDLWTLGAKQLQVGGKNGLKIVSSETAKNGKAGHCVNRLDNIADYTVRAAKAQALGNQNLADLWMYAVKQMKVFQEMEVQPILSHIDGIYDAYFGEKDEQGEKESFVVNPSAQYGCAVSDFVRSVERAADEWDKISEYTAQATEARISGNQEIAELCSQAAMHIQTVAENSVQVAFAHINGNWNEIYRLMEVAKSARMTAHYFVKLADYTAKVTDAETKGNQDIADIWKQVIRQARMAAENRMKANQAVSVGNIDEAERIKKTSYLFRNVISNLIKSVEITTSRLALVDYALLKAKKITENRPLSKLVYADEVQGVDGAQKLSVQELLDASSTGATQQFAAEVELGKRSNEKIADCWRQVATHYENAAKQGASIAHCYKNEDEDNNLMKDKVRELERAAEKEESAAERTFGFIYNLEDIEDYKNKAIAARLEGNQELEKAWNNLAEETQILADLCNQAAQAGYMNNYQESRHLSELSKVHEKHTIPMLFEIADYLTQAAIGRTAGNQDAANLWTQGALELEKALHYTSDDMGNIIRSAKSRAHMLALAAEYTTKAQKNMTAGNQNLACWWSQAVQQSLGAVQYEDQSAQAFINGNEDEADLLGQAAIASWNATKITVKVAQHCEEGVTKTNVTNDLLEERARQFQIAAERFSKAAACRSVENYRASDLWTQAAMQLEIANKSTQCFFLRLHDNFLDHDNRASDFARSVGDELAKVAAVFEGIEVKNQMNNLDPVQDVVNLFVKTAEYRANARVAQSIKNKKLINLWDKAVKQSQLAAKSKTKEIMATMGEKDYNTYLIIMTETLQDSANKFAQAAETFVAGDEAASNVLAQAAERQSELAVEQKSKGLSNAINCNIDRDFDF